MPIVIKQNDIIIRNRFYFQVHVMVIMHIMEFRYLVIYSWRP